VKDFSALVASDSAHAQRSSQTVSHLGLQRARRVGGGRGTGQRPERRSGVVLLDVRARTRATKSSALWGGHGPWCGDGGLPAGRAHVCCGAV